MEQLKWPVEYCESCGLLLATKEPRQYEKGFDSSHRLTWNDICPSCGRGYQVGLRDKIEPKVMTEIKASIPLPSPDKVIEVESEDITESTGEAQTFDKTKMVMEKPKEPEKPAEATSPTLSQNAPPFIVVEDRLVVVDGESGKEQPICAECGKVCKSLFGLRSHQRFNHKKEVANVAVTS